MRVFFNRVWQMMLESNLPGIIGAAIVLLIGWLIALWLSRKVTKSAGFLPSCVTVWLVMRVR